MDPALFRKILADMKDFVLPYTLCLGGSGEPLMHEKAIELIGEALRDQNIERIIVETSGLYMDEAYRSLASGEESGRLITIVNMNGCDSETYAALHGEKHFDRVVENIMALREDLGGGASRLYVQVMKINETESYLDRYYDFWEEKKISIILQKQNTYLGMIEDRRYSDLTPLERTPCWHLQRDLYILSDGTVTFCKQDVRGANSPGSAADRRLADIYAGKAGDYARDCRGERPSSPDCSSCDEWYTFNF
jgi:spiro-SPASM protein